MPFEIFLVPGVVCFLWGFIAAARKMAKADSTDTGFQR